MKILVLNAGSSSQKSALFEMQTDTCKPAPPLWEGKLEWDGDAESVRVRNSQGKELKQEGKNQTGNRQRSVARMLQNLWDGPAAALHEREEVQAVGHRIVHGGPKLTQPALIHGSVKQAIEQVSEIAPLHNRAGLEGIQLAQELFPAAPQVAVFDTGFHRTLPPEASTYAGPYEWREKGIRRYGFHGINHEYCARRAAQLLDRDLLSLKIITCHLGNGCSLAAIDGGKSVDTTMGFTPLEGLMMGTRSGSVDPAILIHLMRTEQATADQLDFMLNHRSGLLGISGASSDMRDVVTAMKQGNERAKLAFDIFVHRLRSEIASMAAALGEVDALVFTAGIGENSAEVRRAACQKLIFLRIELNEPVNSSASPDLDISTPRSGTRVLIIRAQEDWAIARECLRLIHSEHSS